MPRLIPIHLDKNTWRAGSATNPCVFIPLTGWLPATPDEPRDESSLAEPTPQPICNARGGRLIHLGDLLAGSAVD